MPKGRKIPVSGVGLGPVLIILFLLVASIYSISLGRSLSQLGARIAIVAAIVGIVYLAWVEVAKRHPLFKMSTTGETGIILAVVAVALIFVSDPIAVSVGLTMIPDYSTLAVYGGPPFDLANSQVAALFLVLALIALAVLLAFTAKHKSK